MCVCVWVYVCMCVYVCVCIHQGGDDQRDTRKRNGTRTLGNKPRSERSASEGLCAARLEIVQAPRNQYPRKLIAPGESVFRHSVLARR